MLIFIIAEHHFSVVFTNINNILLSLSFSTILLWAIVIFWEKTRWQNKKFSNDKSEKLFSILWSVFLTLKTSTLGFSRILTLNFGKTPATCQPFCFCLQDHTWLCRKRISLNGVNYWTNHIALNIKIDHWVCIFQTEIAYFLQFSVAMTWILWNK